MDGIYGRQSLDKKESISIETQLQSCLKTTGNAPHKFYKDKGYSGKNTDRPDFQQLMRDIENGLISRVVVYKLDRISRSIVDFGRIMEIFQQYKVEFISVNENFDTTTPMGKATLYFIMIFAQLERETIQQRTRDNFFARMENGFGMSGVTPFGYNKVPIIHQGKKTHTYEQDVDAAEIVKRIYEMYANEDEATLLNIASRLTDDPNIARNFNHTLIGRILKNPFYVKADADIYNYLRSKSVTLTNEAEHYLGENGVYIYGTERRELTSCHFGDDALSKCHGTVALHDGLIDSQTWLKCQHKLKVKSVFRNERINKKNPDNKKTWLAGIMQCKYCGKTITSRPGRELDKVYVTCRGRIEHICYERTTPYKVSYLESQVEKDLLAFLSQRADVQALPQNNNGQSKVNSIKIEITKIEEKINNPTETVCSLQEYHGSIRK